jgi:predicted nucleotidyltransferase
VDIVDVNVLLQGGEAHTMPGPEDSSIEGVDLAGMRSYLAETPVEFAVLFGSYARGTEGESSDVDVALGFPEALDARERFRVRNRVDAELQGYADAFVDVSDVESLPTPVAYTALRDGQVLVGDEDAVQSVRERVVAAYEASADDRERERREFVDRLARGET